MAGVNEKVVPVDIEVERGVPSKSTFCPAIAIPLPETSHADELPVTILRSQVPILVIRFEGFIFVVFDSQD